MNFILENSGFHHFIVSSRDFHVRTHKFLLELGFRKEVRKYISFYYITVSVFLSHQVPKTERKKRRKKESDLVSCNLAFFALCYKVIFKL